MSVEDEDMSAVRSRVAFFEKLATTPARQSLENRPAISPCAGSIVKEVVHKLTSPNHLMACENRSPQAVIVSPGKVKHSIDFFYEAAEEARQAKRRRKMDDYNPVNEVSPTIEDVEYKEENEKNKLVNDVHMVDKIFELNDGKTTREEDPSASEVDLLKEDCERAKDDPKEAKEQCDEAKRQCDEAKEHVDEAKDDCDESRVHCDEAKEHPREAKDECNEPKDHCDEVKDHCEETKEHSDEAKVLCDEPNDHCVEPKEHPGEIKDHCNEPSEHRDEVKDQCAESMEHFEEVLAPEGSDVNKSIQDIEQVRQNDTPRDCDVKAGTDNADVCPAKTSEIPSHVVCEEESCQSAAETSMDAAIVSAGDVSHDDDGFKDAKTATPMLSASTILDADPEETTHTGTGTVQVLPTDIFEDAPEGKISLYDHKGGASPRRGGVPHHAAHTPITRSLVPSTRSGRKRKLEEDE